MSAADQAQPLIGGYLVAIVIGITMLILIAATVWPDCRAWWQNHRDTYSPRQVNKNAKKRESNR